MQKWSRCNLIGEVTMKIKVFFLKQIQGRDALNKYNGYTVLGLQGKKTVITDVSVSVLFLPEDFFLLTRNVSENDVNWQDASVYPGSLLRWWLG